MEATGLEVVERIVMTRDGGNGTTEIDATPATAMGMATTLIRHLAEELHTTPLELLETIGNAIKYEQAMKSGVSQEEAWKLYGC
jgi:hypothetical protein